MGYKRWRFKEWNQSRKLTVMEDISQYDLFALLERTNVDTGLVSTLSADYRNLRTGMFRNIREANGAIVAQQLRALTAFDSQQAEAWLQFPGYITASPHFEGVHQVYEDPTEDTTTPDSHYLLASIDYVAKIEPRSDSWQRTQRARTVHKIAITYQTRADTSRTLLEDEIAQSNNLLPGAPTISNTPPHHSD